MALPAPVGDWNDEQKALRKGLAKYYEALNAGVLEDDAAERFNRDKWQLIRESGVIRIPFAEQWGGLGHDALTLVYVLEELGYGCRDAGLLFALATQVVSAAIPLQKFGSDELKERYLARLINGEIISAHAISEPSAGSDAMAMSTTATPDGDGYLLNGGKTFITNGPIADVITVYAKLGHGRRLRRGHHRVSGAHRHARVHAASRSTSSGSTPARSASWNSATAASRGEHRRPAWRRVLHPRARDELGDPLHLRDDGRGDAGADGAVHRVRQEANRVRRVDRLQPVHGGQDRRPEDRRSRPPASICTTRPAGSPRRATSRPRSRWRSSSRARRTWPPRWRPCSSSVAVDTCGSTALEKGLRDAIGAPIYSGTNEMQRVRIASMLGL